MAQTNESQEQVTVNVETLQPVTRTLMTIGALPTSYLISMTYEEQLLWLQNYLIQTVIPAINNNAEATKEVQDIVMALQDYINTQFSELNLQEYIDNKLDEMLESGVFENILMDYVQLTKVYDTYNDMIFDAYTFTNGMKLKTMGYHFINDGGGAEYVVTNVQSDTKYQVSIGTNLWVELINPIEITPEIFGAYGDGVHNDTTAFQEALDYNYETTNTRNYYPTFKSCGNKKYLLDEITIQGHNRNIYFNGFFIANSNNILNIDDLWHSEIYLDRLESTLGSIIKFAPEVKNVGYVHFHGGSLYAKSGEPCVIVYPTETNKYANELSFENTGFRRGSTAIYANGSLVDIGGISLINCGIEGVLDGIIADTNVNHIAFINCRTAEAPHIWTITGPSVNNIMISRGGGGTGSFKWAERFSFEGSVFGSIFGGLATGPANYYLDHIKINNGKMYPMTRGYINRVAPGTIETYDTRNVELDSSMPTTLDLNYTTQNIILDASYYFSGSYNGSKLIIKTSPSRNNPLNIYLCNKEDDYTQATPIFTLPVTNEKEVFVLENYNVGSSINLNSNQIMCNKATYLSN